ncbi:jerky protein homolog-like [Haliotis cracherodii]|uniref:jerky protein homolog-like n=1 Tax=Haliotis cracherodii TaxID=6455 RepID=UPI0039EAD626
MCSGRTGFRKCSTHCLWGDHAGHSNQLYKHLLGIYRLFGQDTPNDITLLKVQAQKMSRQINGDDDTFKASDGWLWRFQLRHGIKSITVSGESKSADVESAAAYPTILQDIIDAEGLQDEQIYNADETGLYYRMLPDKTLAEKNDPRQKTGFKKAKQRVTVLLACNKTGHHKLKPLVIGTAKNPHALHHVNRSTLPVVYQSSKNAWMTAYIFKDCFFKNFIPAVRHYLRQQKLEEKAILLLDNCPAHPPASTLSSHDGKIKAVHLPKNTTSIIQPLDQGIIKAFKSHCKRKLITNLLDSAMPPTDYIQTVTMKDVIFTTHYAWGQITTSTIDNCWKKGLGSAFDDDFLGFTETDITEAVAKYNDYAGEEDLEVDPTSVELWATCDNDLPTSENKSDD